MNNLWDWAWVILSFSCIIIALHLIAHFLPSISAIMLISSIILAIVCVILISAISIIKGLK